MVKNMGRVDRVMRIVVALVLAFIALSPFVEVWFMWVMLGIAAVLLITALINHCPMYKLMDIDSHVHDDRENPYSKH